MTGLDAAQGLSLEGTFMHLHERQLGKDTLEASQSCE